MKYRELVNRDIERVAQWNIELHEDEGSVPMSQEAAEKRLRGWFKSGTFEGVIFIHEERDVGYMVFETKTADPGSRDSQQSIYLRQFYICREHRRSGLGTSAFQSFRKQHVSDNVMLVLDVKVSNPSGQRFWESLGFRAEHIEYHLESGNAQTP